MSLFCKVYILSNQGLYIKTKSIHTYHTPIKWQTTWVLYGQAKRAISIG